ncbi:hypothetical protein O9H85_21075 [Paenibacillus filicis]|uniref:Glycosyltransferase 2-like domain-containing protein n=1 Tax=Paenibacillus gyeongsangnamensis TaxID=3388067 RepID=A0ABT4QDJ1_9BACL|nr:hypothetical protein [Paenibacillus filicis]MCZ8514866.1 hypothetical protein [Paenibacillus filicis]
MLIGLVWIVGCYAAGIALIHILHSRWTRREQAGTVHYALMTRDDQNTVEWFIRSLHFFSWLKGRAITITIIDEGSSDDTLAIAYRLSQEHHLNICMEAALDWDDWVSEHEDEQMMVVRLSQQGSLETAYKFL